MEFITAEQFRGQPAEVQKVFTDWWDCCYGDLYYYNANQNENDNIDLINNDLECNFNGDFEYFKSIGAIPLFTEGQLRKFIEDKTNGLVQIESYMPLISIKKYRVKVTLELKPYDAVESVCNFNLLQAYWKLACMIAKEIY